MTGPDDDGLFDEAVNHAIRLQANAGNRAALDALAGWRARSPAHERVWAEVAEIHGMAGSLMARAPRDDHISRRKALGLCLAGLAVAGGGGLFGPGMILAARADHLTSTAEIRDFVLADGSRITLGPDSAVALDVGPGARGMTLLSGMVWCELVGAPQPFRLACRDAVIQTNDAALGLSEEGGMLSLALDHGAARIGNGADAGSDLMPGDWLELDGSGRIARRIGLAASEASTWRSGVIVVEAEPLEVVVARIARWMPGRVVILDPGLGARPVSGVFDMARPRDALLAAVSAHGAGLRQVSPWVTVATAL